MATYTSAASHLSNYPIISSSVGLVNGPIAQSYVLSCIDFYASHYTLYIYMLIPSPFFLSLIYRSISPVHMTRTTNSTIPAPPLTTSTHTHTRYSIIQSSCIHIYVATINGVVDSFLFVAQYIYCHTL
jgi:hypothetical protein